MPHPKQTVENIRSFLGAPQASAFLDPAALAASYARLCADANQRLRRCADFLREQLRTEAIAFAAQRPPLLDLVSSLDFHELPLWEQYCGVHGLPRPVRVAHELANALRDAVITIEPLRDLLAKHRYLALSRAPLNERLAILRAIAAADPGFTVWAADVEELERARLMELRNAAAAATRSGDGATMDAIIAELGAGPWRVLAAGELKETLASATVAMRQAAVLDQLRAMAPRVLAATASMSFEQCKDVFSEWGRIVTQHRIVVPPDLREVILPMARWIDQQEELRERQRDLRAACQVLVQAIQARAPLEELKLLHRKAVALELEIPPDVDARYREGIEWAQREQAREKRKQYAIGAALVGIILLAIAVLIFVALHGGALVR